MTRSTSRRSSAQPATTTSQRSMTCQEQVLTCAQSTMRHPRAHEQCGAGQPSLLTLALLPHRTSPHHHIAAHTPLLPRRALCSYTHPMLPGAAFGSLSTLKRRLQDAHQLHFCDLCVKGRQVFVSEQVLYSKADLERHCRTGDDAGPLADSGFRGHPSCRFCRQRFYDSDELYKHMEGRHEHCFICRRHNPSRFVYFRDYAELEGKKEKRCIWCSAMPISPCLTCRCCQHTMSPNCHTTPPCCTHALPATPLLPPPVCMMQGTSHQTTTHARTLPAWSASLLCSLRKQS